MSDNRATRYVEERDGEQIVVYRASGLGSCDRVLVALANGYEPADKPEWFQQVLFQGTQFENPIRDRYMAETGKTVVADQREVELSLGEMFGREVIVRGHTDGEVDGESCLFEAKKFRDSTWQNFVRMGVEVNRNYPWQVSVYMHAGELDECDFVGGHVCEVMEGSDKWELTEILVKHLTDPPLSLKAIRNRIYRVEKMIDTGFDAKEVECDRSQYPCPFFHLHDYDTDEWEWDKEQQKVADAWMSSLAAVDDDVRQVRNQLKAAEARKAQVVEGLREFLAESGEQAKAAKRLLGSEYTVTHVVKEIPEHTRKASKQDYFTIKPNKTPDKEGDTDAAS